MAGPNYLRDSILNLEAEAVRGFLAAGPCPSALGLFLEPAEAKKGQILKLKQGAKINDHLLASRGLSSREQGSLLLERQ